MVREVPAALVGDLVVRVDPVAAQADQEALRGE